MGITYRNGSGSLEGKGDHDKEMLDLYPESERSHPGYPHLYLLCLIIGATAS